MRQPLWRAPHWPPQPRSISAFYLLTVLVLLQLPHFECRRRIRLPPLFQSKAQKAAAAQKAALERERLARCSRSSKYTSILYYYYHYYYCLDETDINIGKLSSGFLMDRARLWGLGRILGSLILGVSIWTMMALIGLKKRGKIHLGKSDKNGIISDQGKRVKVKTTTNKIKGDIVIDVVVVGCGLPQYGMGWFHLKQFLEMACDSQPVRVRAVVEPYYLDRKQCPNPPTSFLFWKDALEGMGIPVLAQVEKLRDILSQEQSCGNCFPKNQTTLFVIAGKTHDNPKYFQQCLDLGASYIYLEVPGAPTISDLREMQCLSEEKNVSVFMGYQKLCAKYIDRAVELSKSVPRSHVFFCHNENWCSRDLPWVTSRYHPEGMIHSMACQELAVLYIQYGVKVSQIHKFQVNTNRLFTEKVTSSNCLNGKNITDLARAAFKITTTQRSHNVVSVMADRCGGLMSFVLVKSYRGQEIQRFLSHDEEQIRALEKEFYNNNGEVMMRTQFIMDLEEYLELKRRVVDEILLHVQEGNAGCVGGLQQCSRGVVSIQDGIEIMMLADYCAQEIDNVLKIQES